MPLNPSASNLVPIPLNRHCGLKGLVAAVLLAVFIVRGMESDSVLASFDDSLAYGAQREAIRAAGGYPEEYIGYFEAADALAAEGMFEEARELLADLFAGVLEDTADVDSVIVHHPGMDTRTETVPDFRPVPVRRRKPVLGAVAAVSYDRYDDPGFLSHRGDTIDSLYALRDEFGARPLNGYGRAGLEWTDPAGFLRRASAFLYGSNTRFRAGAAAAGQVATAYLPYDLDLQLEMRQGERYGDSSDVVRGRGGMELTSRPLRKSLTVALPVRIETEQYRRERSQYTSYWEASVRPELELESRDYSRRAVLMMEYTRRMHSESGSRDNEIRLGPRCTGEYWNRVLSGSVEGAYVLQRNPLRKDPSRQRRADFAVRSIVKVTEPVGLGIDAEGFWEKQEYVDQSLSVVVYDIDLALPLFRDVTGSYTLSGFGGQVRPSLRLALPRDVSVTAGMGYDQGYYPEMAWFGSQRLLDTLYISESYRAIEPGLSLGIDGTAFYGSVGLSYRRENVRSERFLRDFTEWKPRMEMTWRIRPWLTLDVSGDYGRRAYSGGDMNISVSASGAVRVKW